MKGNHRLPIGHVRDGFVAEDPCIVDDDVNPFDLLNDSFGDFVTFLNRFADRYSVRSSCDDVVGNSLSSHDIVHCYLSATFLSAFSGELAISTQCLRRASGVKVSSARAQLKPFRSRRPDFQKNDEQPPQQDLCPP